MQYLKLTCPKCKDSGTKNYCLEHGEKLYWVNCPKCHTSWIKKMRFWKLPILIDDLPKYSQNCKRRPSDDAKVIGWVLFTGARQFPILQYPAKKGIVEYDREQFSSLDELITFVYTQIDKLWDVEILAP